MPLFYRQLPSDSDFANVSLLLRGNRTTTEVIQTVAILDESNNNIAITRTGNADVSLITYKYGTSSLTFDGNGDSLVGTLSTSLGTGDFTCEAWVYINSHKDYNTIFDLRSGGVGFNDQLGFVFGTNAAGNFYMYHNGSFRITAGTISTSTWTHVALVRSSGNIKAYVDGNNVGATYSTSQDFSRTEFLVGASILNSSYLNGFIDDLRITRNVARYTSNFTPPNAELTLEGDANSANVSLLLRGNRTTMLETNALLDDSSNNHTISKFGNADVSLTTYKYGNSSLAFDGNGDYLTASNNSAFAFGTGDFTMECWAYFTSFATEGNMLDTRSTSYAGPGITFSVNTSGYVYFYSSGASYGLTSTALTLNTWNHIAVVRSSGVIKIYINGVASSTTNWATNLTDNGLTVGSAFDHRAQTTSYKMHGFLDDARITKGIARYTSNFTPPSAELPNR